MAGNNAITGNKHLEKQSMLVTLIEHVHIINMICNVISYCQAFVIISFRLDRLDSAHRLLTVVIMLVPVRNNQVHEHR